ncbi:alcohol dehydrogenase catalytic domain-containing protein [Fulvimonas sp. R45]|uniref:alcohol dehydrogenase catalytic domain-containing protein n=1 Tax=Fulvimonas sp. R45 TaxID=3045937 RepID=UPI0026600395|nr:alcohol dehydrogenase catalytic domain-containing protein [Fulvimonas sp. R45]MDO1527709.1 alcohol dehydrogenase catalytic domain-containing protein [Fulvimonas sp. R45]
MTDDVVRGAALIANGDGRFGLETIEVDPPAAGEVRVAIVAAGVCHTDHAALRWPGPLVLGHEGAGYVEAIGEGVEGLEIGQPVMLNWAIPCGHCAQCERGAAPLCERTHETDVARLGTSRAHPGATRWRGRPVERAFHLGTFARYTLVRAEAVTPLPPHLLPEVACILGCAVMTGVGSAVNVAAMAPGATAAVLGCGGVGLNVVQGARLAGARTIIAIDRVPARLQRARELGATHALLARDDDAGHARLVAEVRALTDGRGVDHAFEATGVPALAFLPLQLARNGGDALQVSGAHGPATLELTDLFWNKRYLAPLYGGCVPARDFPRLFDWIAQGRLELAALISHRYPMEALARAFDDMLAGRSTKGVLRIA